MSGHLTEMPSKYQTLQIWLPLTALILRWLYADFNCSFSWPWWRHREHSDPRDTKSESKILSTLLIALLLWGLLRMLSTLTFWPTIEELPFHERHAMPSSVNPSFALNPEYWMIFNQHRYQWIIRLWVNVASQMWQHLNVSTLVEINVSGRGKASSWH